MARPARARDGGGSFDGLLAALERREVEPVYLLHGAETFLLEQALELLRGIFVADHGELACEVVRAGDLSAREIVGSARTVSMFAPRRLLVVRGVEDLADDGLDDLVAYLEAPSEGTCLVLVASKINKSRKLYQRANKRGVAHEAAPINDRGLSGWIARRARARGLELGPGAIEVLGEATGTDLSAVDDALERLALYVGDRARVGTRDVEAVVSSSRVRSVFELTDAIGARDVASGLRTLDNMLGNREAPLKIVATLATHVRRLLAASELGPAVLRDHNALAARLSVHWFVAKKLAAQVSGFSPGELRAALVRLARTDRELKSSRRPDVLVMEEMLLDLCLPAARAATGPRR